MAFDWVGLWSSCLPLGGAKKGLEMVQERYLIQLYFYSILMSSIFRLRECQLEPFKKV